MNINLHYIEQGTGTPLILLHGNGEDGTYFEHQLAYFSKTYRVIAIDTRGHGQSPRDDAPFTIRQFAEDLKNFMDAHEISKAHILGFSDGGNIALIFAMKYPERVISLIANGANLNGSGVKPTVQIPIVIGYRIASMFAKRNADAKKNAEMLGLMVNDPNIAKSELQKLTMPVLVIAGTKDMIKDSHTREIHAALPNAELVILEGDHFIANKEYEAFNKSVEAFLEGEVC